MTNVTRISYGVIALMLILVGALHLAVPFLAVLFSYFALHKLLDLAKNKWVALVLFILIVVGVISAGVHFTRAMVAALPEVAENSIPSASAWAEARKIELPFSDFESLKALVIDTIKEQANYLSNVARVARNMTAALFLTLLGVVVAISLLFNSKIDIYRTKHSNTLYSALTEEIAARFRDFYTSFERVMGAQIIISLVNTLLTAIFVLVIQLPNAALVIPITFLCGLLPIVGNLVSNTIIVCLAFTISLKMAIAALIFLIAIHKLEYFLNSKIIGVRIRNPIWLTLLALIIGERLMGIPGMILAPVALDYLRLELSKIEMSTTRPPGL